MQVAAGTGTLHAMTPTKIASMVAVVGGVGWLAKVALIWAAGGTEGLLSGLTFLVGLLGLVVALGAAGYSLVRTAPIWLRLVVSVAFPVLVFMVWQVLDSAIHAIYTRETWFRDEVNIVLAALLAVGLGLWGWNRARAVEVARRPGPKHPRSRGHHLAR